MKKYFKILIQAKTIVEVDKMKVGIADQTSTLESSLDGIPIKHTLNSLDAIKLVLTKIDAAEVFSFVPICECPIFCQ